MPSLHFTDIAVSRLNTPGTYYDDDTPAFGIHVGKHRKTWFVVRGKERLRTTVGRYPGISLSDARKEAKKLLTETPKSLSRKKFGEAYDLWKVAIETKKPRTQKDYKRHIEKRFLPSLGSKKLEDVIFEQVTKATAKLPKALRGEGVLLEEIKERLGM
jgi:hypothetical protein